MVWGSGPPESGSQPIVVGPGVDPEIWWVLSEDNPFSSGPIVCRWGRVWWWPGVGAGLSPVSHLVTSEAGAWRVRSYTAGLRLMGQRG